MKTIDKLIEVFKGEDEVIVICSDKLKDVLDKELSNFMVKGNFSRLEVEVGRDLGFNSVTRSKTTLHYNSVHQFLSKCS